MENQSDKFFKTRWIILGLAILGGGIVFSQFYDVAVIRKNPASLTANLIETSQKKDSLIGSIGISEDKLAELQETELKVDLSNLSDEELRAIRAYLKFKKIKAMVMPSGIPEVYGRELAISFDEVQEAIDRVAPFDLTYGKEKIALTDSELERYINVGSQTACRYCCGVETLVFEDGEAACGCAHSQMMRGLAAYLIKNHSELSDEEILKELNAWRAAYFPKQTLSETLQALEESGEEGITELLQEFPDFLPQMVGGC